MKEDSTINTTSDDSQDRYSPKVIENYWQEIWENTGLNKTVDPEDNQETFYALSMFPYPSGTLHMGHVRNYVITDVIARYKKMQGAAVLHPMGWDAFGLPAENAAIERGINPAAWTKNNIHEMKSQLKKLGLSIDWGKEITTADKEYYKWTQFIFNRLHEKNLAYREKATVNWDPIDQTVLANEQVDNDGRSWRSGALVEKKDLNQWFLKITSFADELDKDLDQLNQWPERVKTMQKNWIGKSVGAEIKFTVLHDRIKNIKVFTTRADTLFGVTYLVLAADSNLVDGLISTEKLNELKTFRDVCSKLTQQEVTAEGREKKGMSLDIEAINPITGEKIPLYVGDYVLNNYGTGVVMGVPGHDERDYKFAKKYNLPIRFVISNPNPKDKQENAYTENGKLINSDIYNGIDSTKAKKLILDKGINSGWAKSCTTFKLRDWLISRQRYWGCPIPIIHCESCGQVRVPDEDLPVQLPLDVKLTGKGKSPLSNISEWIDVKCPKCNSNAKRETDTMDTFICSSWYYLRYIDPSNKQKPFKSIDIDKWLPVKQYVGGIEHAILHLLYSRFITKALKYSGLININEPFKNLLTQGMVQSTTYKNKSTSRYYSLEEIKDLNDPKDPITGEKLEIIYEKMSKSKYNGVDPGIVVDKYGADTARMFILFKAPPEKDLEWEDSDVEGQYRFLQRLWRLVTNNRKDLGSELNIVPNNNKKELKILNRYINLAIKEVTGDLNKNQFNTAISELMKLSNYLINYLSLSNTLVYQEGINNLIKMIAPFAPHLAEELWKDIGNNQSIHLQDWPIYNTKAIELDEIKIIIQVNGKVRGSTLISKGSSEDEIKEKVLETDTAKKWLANNKPKRIIVVPQKLVNIVI